MLDRLKKKAGEWFFAHQLKVILKKEREIDSIIGQRVAEIVSKMDPFEPLMKQFHGVFSEEYQHPEQQLSDPGQIQMEMLGFQLKDDPSFRYLTEWMMNTQGNATIKAPNLNRDTALDIMLYGRAQISTMILLKKEVSRLASLHQERLRKSRGETISTSTVGE